LYKLRHLPFAASVSTLLPGSNSVSKQIGETPGSKIRISGLKAFFFRIASVFSLET
jgi:hypothetical protein